MGAHADQETVPGLPACILDREIILSEMDSIGIGGQRDVQPVIDHDAACSGLASSTSRRVQSTSSRSDSDFSRS